MIVRLFVAVLIVACLVGRAHAQLAVHTVRTLRCDSNGACFERSAHPQHIATLDARASYERNLTNEVRPAPVQRRIAHKIVRKNTQRQVRQNPNTVKQREDRALKGVNFLSSILGNIIPFNDFGIFTGAVTLIGSAVVVNKMEHRELTPVEGCSTGLGALPIIGLFANSICEKGYRGMEICDMGRYYEQRDTDTPSGRDLYRFARYQKFRRDNDCAIVEARRVRTRRAAVVRHKRPRIFVRTASR